MKRFARLYHQLDQSRKAQDRVQAWLQFLKEAPEEDKLWMMALYCGKGPSRTITNKQIWQWATEASGFSPWMIEASHAVVGDKAETVALLLPSPQSTQRESLSVWMKRLVDMKGQTAETIKETLHKAWDQMDGPEKWVFHKFVTGGFRAGTSLKLLVKALSIHTEQPTNLIFERLQEEWHPLDISWEQLMSFEEKGDQLGKPYPFNYAREIEEDEVENLGPPREWLVAWDRDGMRVQLILRGGKLFIWNDEEELITAKLPELSRLRDHLQEGTVLDGFLMVVKNDKIMPVSALQTRLGRKNITKKALKDTPVQLHISDILEEKGQDIRDLSFTKRIERLKKITDSGSASHGLVQAEIMEFDSWDEIKEAHLFARNAQAQGLILKRKDAPYQLEGDVLSRLSWKSKPLTVLGVMIYAQRETGGRNYNTFTLAAWQDEGLIPFAKVDQGLSEEELLELNEWVRGHTEERFGPVRSVQARLVFEVGFDAIEYSKRRKSGMVLKAPRILRWCKELQPEEAGTMAELNQLLEKFGG